ncbi:hypothetical protein [Pseudomonas typographi]|uniref:Uncharacterized protein n=1 Tax=Pseudomonas typographi TaxID=2715964 RepID=A0ABR7ZA54_9PSED|nr:hypothetical protein [Pseudomonas typographi]MBD1590173.1 hypothetical protein [Pseudomonas typographi]MBD1602257.1 hypothetical protein [Pseudomonas typographi]
MKITWIVGMAMLVGNFSVGAAEFTKAQKSKIEEAVKDRLSDPDSAKFKFPPYKGGDVYCGTVNAKNKMGGYVGFSPFQIFVLSGGKSFMLIGVGGDESSSYVLNKSCDDAGYSL